MPGRYVGRTVLVTGASAGIGRAAVLRFAAEGARVVATARRLDRLEALGREAPGAVHPVQADVADAAAMEALAARVLREWGVPDVVVANAGVGLDARFAESSDDLVRRVFETNVLGVYRTVRPFLPGMVARGSGRVLLVSSVVGLRGVPNYSAYSGSKFWLHGAADAMRAELRGSGVSVGLVCPSSTATEFQEASLRRGPSQKRVRPLTHSADSVARVVVRMGLSRRRMHVCSVEGRFMRWAQVVAPGLMDAILHRVLVRGRDAGSGTPR